MLTFGTDPEYFSCVNFNGEKLAISPALLEVESKLKPVGGNIKHPIYINKEDFNWIGDGAAWEITLKKPHVNAKDLFNAVQGALECLEETLTKYTFMGEKLELVKKPVVQIDPLMYLKYLEKNEKIFYGFIFGCDEDQEAILKEYTCKTLDVKTHQFRYGGGHFHTGYDKDKIPFVHRNIIPMIQLQSIFLGNNSIANSQFIEEEKMRSETYGTPGRFRHQKWGTEYRTPSNSWTSNLETTEKMVEYSYIVWDLFNNPQKGREIIDNFLPSTIQAIKESNQKLSKTILEEIA